MARPPTWLVLRAEVLRRIREREWPPGASIPHEADLAVEFGCARATVSRALRDLAAGGYLERRRKGGTRVSPMPVRKAIFDIPVIRADVELRGMAHGYRLLLDNVEPLTDTVRARLALPAGTAMRRVKALHLADGAPFCIEDRWLDPVWLPRTRAQFDTLSANEWLVLNASFSHGDYTILARKPDATTARLLGCSRRDALLSVERTVFGEGGHGPLSSAELVYRPGYRVMATV